MNIKPVGDRVVIQLEKVEEKTKSGIILPDTVNQDPKAEGTIISIGDGEKVLESNLMVGAMVIYSRYSGDDVESDGERYKIIKHEDILAVIEK